MRVRIDVDVQDCEQCPYHKSEKVYTSDSFEDVRRVYCTRLKKNVYNYLDWNETATIPKECEFMREIIE